MKLTHSFWPLVALVAVAAFFVAGGAAPAQADPTPNPFAGTWSGTFSAVEFEAEGTVDWTITASGKLTGTFYNTTIGAGGTMTGHIDRDGTLHLNPNPSGPGEGGGGSEGEHHTGQCYIDEDGNLVAPTTGTWHEAYSVVAILAPV